MEFRTIIGAMIVTAGCGRIGFDDTSQYVFVDEAESSFDLGTYDAGSAPLVWRDRGVQFASAPPYASTDAGIYLSRVLDTGDPNARWDTLAWLSPSPQGRPLADNEGSDTGYGEGMVGMTNNILLLHLDGSGDTVSGDQVPDTSGRGHHGDVVHAGQAARYVAGAFGNALDIDRDAWIHLDGNYFDYGTSDITYSVWVRMSGCADSNANRIALGGAAAGDAPHVWIGARCPDPCPGGDGANMTWFDSTRTGSIVNACTGVVLDDGNWHHLAGVKSGHTNPAANLVLYVDGREVGRDTHDYGGATFTYDGGEIRLGGFNLTDPLYHTRIMVDEAAIWKRALSPAEIDAVYHRGALHLELQFRVCPDGSCDSEPFVGPDGTTSTYFTEEELVGLPGSQRENLTHLGLVGPVAQYRARFSTSAAARSPGLLRVAIHARP